jgi:hypothetical protein
MGGAKINIIYSREQILGFEIYGFEFGDVSQDSQEFQN